VIYELPTAIESDGAATSERQKEYHSALFLSPTCVLVADGQGTLYVLPIREQSERQGQGGEASQPIGVFVLKTELPFDVPFALHHLHRASPTRVFVLLSSRHYPQNGEKPKANATQFDIHCAKIDLLSLHISSASEQPRTLDIAWTRRGSDLPSFATFAKEFNSWLILSGSTYTDPNTTKSPKVKPYQPTPDEIAPIPRADENLDLPTPSKPHPYSWTQTEDGVTIAFALPSTATKHDIKVLFTAQTLTIHISGVEQASPDIPLPHYSAKLLWDTVNSSSCFWTWDREGEKGWGLLTCHMEKRNEGTRWPQVFATTTVKDKDKDGKDVSVVEDDVPETVDPSELYKIRESLEKYTSSLQTGEDASGLGLGTGVPSLAAGEMDQEVDAAIGRGIHLTWVGIEGEDVFVPNEEQEKDGDVTMSAYDEEADEVKLLSTALPGSLTSSDPLSVVLKRDLDGLLYTLSRQGDSATPTWTHTTTFSALAFVLASKQDTRFTYHLPSNPPSSPKSMVLAFESGTVSLGRAGNVYIYGPPDKPKDPYAKQAVLKIGESGALLGVGCVFVGEERQRVLVCLAEDGLVLVRGL